MTVEKGISLYSINRNSRRIDAVIEKARFLRLYIQAVLTAITLAHSDRRFKSSFNILIFHAIHDSASLITPSGGIMTTDRDSTTEQKKNNEDTRPTLVAHLERLKSYCETFDSVDQWTDFVK
jgi:hypothetical protein